MTMPLPVDYFDGRSSRRQAATLDLREGNLVVGCEAGERRIPLGRVELTEPLGNAPRVLRFADDGGGYCEIRQPAAFAAWSRAVGFRPGFHDTLVVRLQSRWRWAAGALLAVALVLFATYYWVLPAAAARIAPTVPAAWTQMLSDAAMKSIDDQLLHPSRLSGERQAAIMQRIRVLADANTSVPAYRIVFRSAPVVGPNAFALPSGQIVVLDELVAIARDDDDVAAVIAHEIGHVAHFHGMRQLIQSAVVSFVVGAYLGDVSSLAASLSTLAVESSYSREFEFEADRYGGRLLLQGGSSPTRLADMLLRLEMSHAERAAGKRDKGSGDKDAKAPPAGSPPESDGIRLSEFLSTHPDTRKRVDALRAMR